MKRKTISGVGPIFGILLALCLSLTLPFHSWGAAKTRVAVIDFEQKGEQEFRGRQVGEIVAELLITSLVRTGRFDVVERAQLQKILKEQQMGMSGMISQETASKVGELLGVKVIITGSVIRLGNIYDVNTRLINVEDGSILKAEKIRGPGLDAIERMMDSLADTIKKDFPIEGYVVMVTGKRAMIDLGKIHGVDPGMNFLAFRKGAPVRHPVTGKMLKGEDIKLGEMAVQTVQTDTSWAEITKEEPGAKIAPGNLARSTGLEVAAAAPVVSAPPTPSRPAPVVMKMWAGKGYGEKIVMDWNGDGKIDLLVGNGGGYLHFFPNAGSVDSLDFAPGVMVQAAGKDLDVGGKASPCVVDWNEDGKIDLLMGNGSGEIFIFLNKGTNEDPQYDNKGEKLSIKFGENASPRVISWSRPGANDLVVADRSGEVSLCVNTGIPQSPAFSEKKVLRAGKPKR
ncbi:MAG: VCBS repeat-containing protein [Proteobacteria bacterium]|nr:VCBS repeat-containing protein [Pseudomonadota bacterium]